MELRSPVTLAEHRAKYALTSNEDLWALLQVDPEHLTPEARQALAEEASRRGISRHVAPPTTRVAQARPREYIYPKAPLGERFLAYLVDSIIGVGPAIT